MRAMLRRIRSERGQTIVEFGIICTVLLMLTAGLVDTGRAFYQYNAIATAARYGARWGSVVGGACGLPYGQSSATTDWCNKNKVGSGAFWAATGNAPLQGVGVACPSYSSTPADWYIVGTTLTSDSSASKQPTSIVGAVAQKFDTSSSSSNFITGGLTPGFDQSKLAVCIALSGSSTTTPGVGTSVTVEVYYPFDPVSGLLPRGQLKMLSTSTYVVE